METLIYRTSYNRVEINWELYFVEQSRYEMEETARLFKFTICVLAKPMEYVYLHFVIQTHTQSSDHVSG